MDTTGLQEFIDEYENTDLGKLFRSKEYSTSSIDFLPNMARTLNYYKTEGFLPERPKKSKFSFLDLIWLRIIFNLRQLGVNNDLICKLKEEAFSPFDMELFSDLMRESEKEIKKRARELLKKIPEEYHEGIMAEIDKSIIDGTYGKDLLTCKLVFWIGFVIIQKIPGEIHLYPDGKVEFNSLDQNFMPMVYFVHKTYISISITEILSFYLSKDFISTALLENYFSEDELIILETVRKEKCKSIKINYKDKLVDLIEIEKDEYFDKAQRISEVFLENSYEDITIKTQNGKIVSCKKVIKLKPQKKK